MGEWSLVLLGQTVRSGRVTTHRGMRWVLAAMEVALWVARGIRIRHYGA